MLIWGGRETYKPRWLAGAAFTALSLPLLFVPGPSEVSPLANASSALTSPERPGARPAETETPSAPSFTTTRVHKGVAVKPRRKRIVVSLRERRLALVDQGRVVKTYAVAVGTETSPSPTGEFTIVTKVTDPTYYRPGTVIAAGADNPLGSRWLGLDREHYGIHGTNEPGSIGRAASHGCIRMGKHDVEELFSLARVGDSVEISEEPLQQLAQLAELAAELTANN